MVDLSNDLVRLAPRAPAVDTAPSWLRLYGFVGVVERPGARSLVNCWNPVEAACLIGEMADHGVGAVAPFVHQAIVQVGPVLRRRLDRAPARHADDASRTPAAASALVRVDRQNMRVWIAAVVALAIVNGADVTRDPLGDRLREVAREGDALLVGRFHRQGDDEALRGSPAPLLCGLFGSARRDPIGTTKALAYHGRSRGSPGDIPQMRCRLTHLRRSLVALSLRRERPRAMSK